MAENYDVKNPFSLYDPNQGSLDDLIDSLVKPSSGFEVVEDSVELKTNFSGEDGSLSIYDGSIDELGIGPGLLFTSGDGAPPLENTGSGYSESYGENGKFTQNAGGVTEGYTIDDEVEQVAQDAFQGAGSTTEATILKFDINVTDPTLKSLKFDFVFGSEEYPNYIDSSFVDIGALLVEGENYALFKGEEDQPLSVISENVELGNFMNNTGSYQPEVPSNFSNADDVETVEYPIEYNAVSEPLTVNAPVEEGENSITIAVSDTGDQILDTGMFLSSIVGTGTEGGKGIVDQDEWENPFADYMYDLPYELDDDGDFLFGQNLDGSTVSGSLNNLITAKFDFSIKDIEDYDFALEDKYNFIEIDAGEHGTQKFVYAQKMVFDDFAAAMDTWEGSDTWNTFSLLKIAFGSDPTPELMTEWLLEAEESESTEELAGLLIDEYAPDNFSTEDLVSHLYKNATGNYLEDPSSQVNFLKGLGLDSSEEILSYAAENYADMSPIQGKFVPLDADMLNNDDQSAPSEDDTPDSGSSDDADGETADAASLIGVVEDDMDISAAA